jgi:hypothetical protein
MKLYDLQFLALYYRPGGVIGKVDEEGGGGRGGELCVTKYKTSLYATSKPP